MRISFPFSHHSGIHQLILRHPFFPSMQFSGYHNLLSHIPFDFLSLYGILPCILFLLFTLIRDIIVYPFYPFRTSHGYANLFSAIPFLLITPSEIQRLTFTYLFHTLSPNKRYKTPMSYISLRTISQQRDTTNKKSND